MSEEEMAAAIQSMIKRQEFVPKESSQRPYKIDLKGEMAAVFSPYFAADYIQQNLDFPEPFLQFLDHLEYVLVQDDDWQVIYNAVSTVKATKNFLADWGDELLERRKDGTPFTTDKMYLCFGYWSDKHDYVLCCDKSSAQYGQVFDVWDSHPWLSDGFLTQDEWDSFTAFLASLS